MQPRMASPVEPELIVTGLKRRFTGVSATISALLPQQARRHALGYCGVDLPGLTQALADPQARISRLGLRAALNLSRRRLPDGRSRIWHVRRNHEMLLGLLLRDGLGCPVRLVFTSAAIRRHSALPRWMIGRMDAVVATTEAAVPPLSAAARVAAVVPHGVDVQRFAPPPDRRAAWRALGLPGARGVGIVGRVREEKGVHLFVQAMIGVLPRHPDVTAVIVGLTQPGDRAFADRLREQVDAAGLGGRFIWAGAVEAADMPRWYQALDLLVACPLYEGFGLTVAEAMASGCAVVASRTGAFAQMVQDGTTGSLVPVGEAAPLTAAVDHWLADPAACEQAGRAGRLRAEQGLSVQAEAEALGTVYERLWRGEVVPSRGEAARP